MVAEIKPRSLIKSTLYRLPAQGHSKCTYMHLILSAILKVNDKIFIAVFSIDVWHNVHVQHTLNARYFCPGFFLSQTLHKIY